MLVTGILVPVQLAGNSINHNTSKLCDMEILLISETKTTDAYAPCTEISIESPPTRLWPVLLQMGPGLIIAGSIVGSGELIATTKTGAQSGLTLLWLILFGCMIKVFVQVEIGRFTIINSESSLKALNRVPGKVAGINWILWTWVIMMIVSFFQLGGIVGGVGQALAITCPITRDYVTKLQVPGAHELKFYHQWSTQIANQSAEFKALSPAEQERLQRGVTRIGKLIDNGGERARKNYELIVAGREIPKLYTYDDRIWAGIATLVTAFLLYYGRYNLIQNLTTALVVIFTLVTLGNAISLQFIPQWSVSLDQLIEGLAFHLPSAGNSGTSIGTALSAFGVIGVGASEIIQYPYWCLEKGYARKVGVRDGDKGWLSRAKGWIRIMIMDSFFSMIIYTTATMGFLFIGATVLYRECLDPDNEWMVYTLVAAYVPVYGAYAKWLFLGGAFAVLYSTFLVAIASHSRTLADFFQMIRWTNPQNQQAIDHHVSLWGVAMPVICFLLYVADFNPVQAILWAGTTQAMLLPMLGIATLIFRYQYIDPRLKPGIIWDICLILSVISFIILAGWKILDFLQETKLI